MKFFKRHSGEFLKGPSQSHLISHFGKKSEKSPDRNNQLLLSPVEGRNSLSNGDGTTGMLRSIRRSESRESESSQKSQKQVRFALPLGLPEATEKDYSEEFDQEVERKKQVDSYNMSDIQLYEDEEERNNGTKKGVRELSYIGVSFRKK